MRSTSARDPRLRELGQFFQARRREVRPDSVGLDDSAGRRRQTTGLRREEVARLVFISPDYYTSVEQGRRRPAREVLDRLIAIFQLDDDQRRYVDDLFGRISGALPTESETPAVSPVMSGLLAQLGDIPAMVIGPSTAILGWNAAAAELFIEFGEVAAPERTYARLLFTNPEFQRRFRDLRAIQEVVVGVLRASATDAPADPQHIAQVEDLIAANPTFHALWVRHGVTQPHEHLRLVLHHPNAGDIVVDQVVLRNVDSPSQRLLLFPRAKF